MRQVPLPCPSSKYTTPTLSRFSARRPLARASPHRGDIRVPFVDPIFFRPCPVRSNAVPDRLDWGRPHPDQRRGRHGLRFPPLHDEGVLWSIGVEGREGFLLVAFSRRHQHHHHHHPSSGEERGTAFLPLPWPFSAGDRVPVAVDSPTSPRRGEHGVWSARGFYCLYLCLDPDGTGTLTIFPSWACHLHCGLSITNYRADDPAMSAFHIM